MVAQLVIRVLLLPAAATVVVEALEVTAKVDALVAIAQTTLHILQVRVDLNALAELGRLNVDKGGAHSPIFLFFKNYYGSKNLLE